MTGFIAIFTYGAPSFLHSMSLPSRVNFVHDPQGDAVGQMKANE